MNIWTVVALVVGLILLVGGAALLVKSASKLATAAGISPLVIGLTVVAFGTSAPELAVSLQAGLSGQSDIALGNVVGSNICNVLLILGVSSLIMPLAVTQQLIRLDVPIVVCRILSGQCAASRCTLGRLDWACSGAAHSPDTRIAQLAHLESFTVQALGRN